METPNSVKASEEVHVFVGMFSGLVARVEVFRDGEQAEEAFQHYTGIDYEDYMNDKVQLHFNQEESTIYSLPLK